SSCECRSQDQRKHLRDRVSPLSPTIGTQSSYRSNRSSTVSTHLANPAPKSPLRGTRPSRDQTIEATAHLANDSATPKSRLSDPTTERSTKSSASTLIFDPGVLLLGLTVRRAVEGWSTDSHLEHVAGVWVAQAIDLTRGVFYRAPYGSYGYGGTRYFPLFFSLHGAAIKVFGDWRSTGYALSAISVVLLLVAVYYLSRRIRATPWLAVAACLAALAGTSVQEALLTIREDAMAAMLNMWGVAICAGEY